MLRLTRVPELEDHAAQEDYVVEAPASEEVAPLPATAEEERRTVTRA